MSDEKLSSVRLLELSFIREDALFLTEMIMRLEKHNSAAIFAPSLVPYFSLFTIESYQYFQRHFPDVALSLFLSYEQVIRRSRMCIKFFEDKKKQIDEIFESLDWIIKIYRNFHIESHKGILAPLKKLFQNDLGIFLYDKQIIGSNYTGLFNLGFNEDDLPEKPEEISDLFRDLTYSVAQELGRYARDVLVTFGIDITKQDVSFFDYSVKDELLGYVDTKGARFLGKVFNGAENIQLNLALLIFLTQTIFLLQIFTNLTKVPSYTLFNRAFAQMNEQKPN